MAATIIDSRIFGNIFSTDAMRAVWSDENRTAKYVAIEKALAIVQGRLGIIPRETADEIVRNCDISKIDMDQLRAQTERIGYPILGVVSQLNGLCRDQLGEYCHWGATTQDITDTATVLLASIEHGAMAPHEGLMAELGLGIPAIAWHTVRDSIAEVGAFLGLVGGTLGKISMDVKLMMQTEVGEVYEPFAHGRGSSSTMPQKRNPIS